MYEHATLQEAYTGALIAGKGKALNNISIIMERARLPTADWARVRFGAGTPWRRCWCVITPPDEKEVQKLQKQLNKKRSAYDRSKPPLLKGDIKFYDSKKTKKVRPIATISDAYSAFAIYPQSKPLIDASTLVKVEGSITIHSNPPSTTEGFVFVMPEVHPAVTGFEMMLRWLFPVFDTFGLYGRPGRLVADTSDPRSLMFAMPKHRRYGYLEILDVTGLILEPGSATWRESEWRKKMKDLTAKRMTAVENGSRTNSRYSSRRSTRNSFGPSRSRIQFDDNVSIRSSPSITWGPQGPPADGPVAGLPRTDSAPPGAGAFTPSQAQAHGHTRSASEAQGMDRFQDQGPSGYDGAYEPAPTPPPHAIGVASGGREGSNLKYMASTPERVSSEDEARITPVRELQELQATTSPEPVSAPPAFAHAPGAKPASKPYHSPELRRANSRMSNATLSQLAGAGGVAVGYPPNEEGQRTSEDQRRHNVGRYSEEDNGQRGVLSDANTYDLPANRDGLNEGLVADANPRFSFEQSSPSRHSNSNVEAMYSRPPPQFAFSSSQNPPTSYQQNSGRSAPTSDPVGEPAFNNRMYEPPNAVTSAQSRSQAPPVFQGHVSQPSTDSIDSTGSQPSRLHTGASINRKPLPVRSSSIQTPTSAETMDSAGSLGRHVMDQAGFDMIGHNDQRLNPMPDNPMHRQKSGASSVYEDTASTASPEYASTRASIETQKPEQIVDKPRAGVMRTVGDPQAGAVQQQSSAPIHIDFGPTLNLASDRPLRNQSPGPAQGYAAALQYGGGSSSGPAMNNYPPDRAPRQRSPAARPGSSGLSNSPQRKAVSTEQVHHRNGSGDSRTLPWQPGMSSLGVASSSQQAITPEQYVQQRAAATTLYAHQRQNSGNVLRANTPTPPPVRNRSSEYLSQLGHSRNNSSVDLVQRPASRRASTALGGPAGSGDMPTTLSAREQEHVARMTGQPLINMAQNKPTTPGGGLIGAIGVREIEKEQLKQGINSRTVQQAITKQQQQQQQMAYQQQHSDQMPAEYRAPASQYGNMGQYPAQFPGHVARQQSWVSPAAQVFAQGGGFTAPTPPTFPTPPEQAGSPFQQYPRQNYFQQQQPGGQGRGNSPGFHGHGY
jgi:CCR4-NOT transcriptional complex subunit CAF120